MYYHAWLRLEGGSQTWANLHRVNVIDDVVVPYINRQIVPVQYGERRDVVAVLNFGSAAYLSVVRSPRPLQDTSPQGVYAATINGEHDNCTRELLDEAVLSRADDEEAKSLIQYALKPPKRQVFVVMPFGDTELDSTYRTVIKPAIEGFGYVSLRADEIQDAGMITTQTLEAIASSELVLCELSKQRANCYYEAGFAKALGRTLILTIRAGEPPAFDLSGNRFIVWTSGNELRGALEERLRAFKDRSRRRASFVPS